MTGTAADAGKGDPGKRDAGNPAPKVTRSAKLPLERRENLPGQAGTSHVPVKPAHLEEIIEKLAVPVAAGTDAAQSEAELEARRQSLLQEALEMAEVRREFGITVREYNLAHGFTPVAARPSPVEDRKSVV